MTSQYVHLYMSPYRTSLMQIITACFCATYTTYGRGYRWQNFGWENLSEPKIFFPYCFSCALWNYFTQWHLWSLWVFFFCFFFFFFGGFGHKKRFSLGAKKRVKIGLIFCIFWIFFTHLHFRFFWVFFFYFFFFFTWMLATRQDFHWRHNKVSN